MDGSLMVSWFARSNRFCFLVRRQDSQGCDLTVDRAKSVESEIDGMSRPFTAWRMLL